MRVADQQVDTIWTRPPEHIDSEHANACAAIQYEIGAILSANLNAGSVTAINSRAMSRCRDRSTRSPKAYMHQATFSALSPPQEFLISGRVDSDVLNGA